jgi:plastocyanin
MNLRRSTLGCFFGLLLAAPAESATHEILMTTVDYRPRFVPSSITIGRGDTVRWINMDPFFLDHRVASGTGSADPAAGVLFDSGVRSISEYFDFTFTEVGEFEFFSVPHEYTGMSGAVRVTTTTDVPSMEHSTWGTIKEKFSLILPRD